MMTNPGGRNWSGVAAYLRRMEDLEGIALELASQGVRIKVRKRFDLPLIGDDRGRQDARTASWKDDRRRGRQYRIK